MKSTKRKDHVAMTALSNGKEKATNKTSSNQSLKTKACSNKNFSARWEDFIIYRFTRVL